MARDQLAVLINKTKDSGFIEKTTVATSEINTTT